MKLTKEKEKLIDIRLNDLCNELSDLDGVTQIEYGKATLRLGEEVDKIKFKAQKAR